MADNSWSLYDNCEDTPNDTRLSALLDIMLEESEPRKNFPLDSNIGQLVPTLIMPDESSIDYRNLMEDGGEIVRQMHKEREYVVSIRSGSEGYCGLSVQIERIPIQTELFSIKEIES
jgi:hypothetical protein